MLCKIFNSENPIKELVNSENNDMVNIAEDVVYLVEGEIIRHRAEFWVR